MSQVHSSRARRLIGAARNRVRRGEALKAATSPAAAPSVPVDRQRMRGTTIQSRAVSQGLRVTARPTLSLWSYTHRLPWPTDLVDRAGAALPAIEGTEHQPVNLQNCRAEWIQGPGANSEHAVLYLHGGAFLCCGLHTHRRMESRISAISQASVLAVDYRMLPNHTISDSISDGVDGYRWLLDNGYAADQIVIAGDSAGGYLSFAVPLAIEAAGLPMPAGIAAVSPLTELDPSRKIAHPNSRKCAMFPRHAVPALTKISDRMDQRAATSRGQAPRTCPVDADLRGMPPVLIQVGSHEMVYADAQLMADRLADAGVPCELQVWDNQPHVFPVFADLIPEGHQAIAEIGRFVRSAQGALLTAVQ